MKINFTLFCLKIHKQIEIIFRSNVFARTRSQIISIRLIGTMLNELIVFQ